MLRRSVKPAVHLGPIVQGNAISAIVTDAANYNRVGYYASPYNYKSALPIGSARYEKLYCALGGDTIESFGYEPLQFNITE